MSTFTAVCLIIQGVCWCISAGFKARSRHYQREMDRLRAESAWLDACAVAQQEKNTVLEAEIITIEAAR